MVAERGSQNYAAEEFGEEEIALSSSCRRRCLRRNWRQDWRTETRKSQVEIAVYKEENNLLENNLLEDGFAAGRREIRDSRAKLDEAQATVIEDLTLLAELYSKVKDRSGVEKTSRKIEEIEEEFAKAQDCYQEYLDANKDEISGQASGFSVKMSTLHT